MTPPAPRLRLPRRWLLALVGAMACAGVYLWWVRPPDAPALPAAPPGVVVGVPARTLRFAAYNVYHNFRGMDGTVAEIRKLDPPPDFLVLSEIDREHVAPMADALGLPHRFYPSLGHVAGGERRWPGVALLSRHRLFDGRALFTNDGPVFGLMAFAIVDDRKFAVAGVHLWPTFLPDPRQVIDTSDARKRQLEVIRQTWRDAGRPPLVVGGDFNHPAVGGDYLLMTRDFNDTLGLLGETGSTFGRKLLQVRIDYLMATPDWEPVAGGVIRGNASDHRPVWVDLKAAPPGATTRPATRPVNLLLP